MKSSDFKVYLSAYHNEVTGSRLLLAISLPDEREYRILVDCGYFQEVKYRTLNYVDDIDPSTIDAILVTHNHVDHTGLIPKMVKQGYEGPIYMTEFTLRLLPKFLLDSAEQQEENAKYLRDKFPGDEWKFNALYHKEDIPRTLSLCEGVKFEKTISIFPGVKVTFLKNGHNLGASMIVIQISSYGRKPLNFLFTGDYRLSNPFFEIPNLPAWLKKMELILVHEATYGTTRSSEIKVCFKRNLCEGFKRRQSILIGAFAQGRMQEILYDLKKMQDEGMIPEEYIIAVDGPLGINTTEKYREILKEFNPETSDFIPKDLMIMDPKARPYVLQMDRPIILVTTSGMLSNGPAKQYVPMFLEHEGAMIHLTGYAAEETLARTLLEAKRAEAVTVGGVVYEKKAVVKTTREKTSHATLDEMLQFISQLDNVIFMAINHGEESVKESFMETVENECPNVKSVDILNRQTMFCIYQFGCTGDKYSNIVIKKMPAKLRVISPEEKAANKKRLKEKRKRAKKEQAKKKAAKRKVKAKRK